MPGLQKLLGAVGALGLGFRFRVSGFAWDFGIIGFYGSRRFYDFRVSIRRKRVPGLRSNVYCFSRIVIGLRV